ncbi:MAG: NAD(P)/FAD-dependent oxidoreductase [Casimicrobiaceae bacterium]|nr:NAD(P)/FAD-dependent oxidoreductase [Casimicrobiaceae bacterium]
MDRRAFLSTGVIAMTGWLTPARLRAQGRANVVVIGGGFGGLTCARYLREFAPRVNVTLVEPAAQFVSCPMSNRVIQGAMGLRDLTRSYEAFAARFRISWIQDSATAIDPSRREVATAGGRRLAWDRLIVAPGIDFDFDAVPGLSREAQARVLHAWKAGPQTIELRDRLAELREGGVVAMHIPKVPYRCPPGPYERASLIAARLKQRNPRAKLLVFDANPEIQSKKGLFERIWAREYKGLITYTPNAEIASVGADGEIVFAAQGKVKADLWNLIPPQRAGRIAMTSGLANAAGGRWCAVDFRTYESTALAGVHVVGDSIQGAPGMPKSGHMANQQGKVCALAIARQLAGEPPLEDIAIANTCYSFVTQSDAIHVAAVYRYDPKERTMKPVQGAGGLSDRESPIEGIYAMGWITNILDEMLGPATL